MVICKLDRSNCIFNDFTILLIRQTDHRHKERTAAANSGLAKVAVRWLIEHLCFVSSSVVADSFVLRPPPARASVPTDHSCET